MLITASIFAFLGAGLIGTDGDSCLRLGTADGDSFRQLGEALQAEFDEAGLCHKITYWPPVRLDTKMQNGDLDGEVFCTRQFIEAITFPHHVIETPVSVSSVLLIARKKLTVVDGIVQGQAFGRSRNSTWQKPYIQSNAQLVDVPSYEQAVNMLDHDRFDGFFAFEKALAPELLDGLRSRDDISIQKLDEITSHIILRPGLEDAAATLEIFLKESQ